MIKTDDNHLLFIEPKGPASEKPTLDLVARAGVAVLRSAVPGPDRYRGFHICCCGVGSGNQDLFVEGEHGPVLVNSLLVHYLMWHREEVPPEELTKLARITAQREDYEVLLATVGRVASARYDPAEEESRPPKKRKYADPSARGGAGTKKAGKIIAEAKAWVEQKKAEGWTREDFVAGLGEILGIPKEKP